uniref:THO complex subunit 2 n=1 Tax=Kwoniella dejecticola CBS 10117 TaxID=1296121 RepID=A0A1A6A6U2_9TREE|nr:uncharacterized protein I303_03491 [Kwoniella dejecticola CBS 10117]OBR85779.1 hypothetical protein I303_03491 [Kwoniella dejecticola CBS 10117]
MPPRRGTKKTAESDSVDASTSSHGLLLSTDVGVKIADALQSWTSEGETIMKEIVTAQLEQATVTSTTLATIPLANTFSRMLSSELEADVLADFFAQAIEGLDDDHVELFGEALVDVVEMMEQEKEDTKEEKNPNEDVEMVGEEVKPKPNIVSGLAVIKLLLGNNKLPPHIVNLLLNPDRLVNLGLHPFPTQPQALQKALVKKNTTLFFKQRKYNLMRECSEGFSGLIVLLTSPDALPHSVEETLAESESDRKIRAKRVWSKIMGLIGYFNLSPPRVLDIILEIASCHVATHWRFFLDLLKRSPWGSASASDIKGKGKAVETWPGSEVDSIGDALHPGGDRVLAQVLGFKFGFYQKPEGGDTPMGLTYMAALLIKHGFVSLADLLPFLSPNDSQMEEIRRKWYSSVSSRSGPSNALSNSVLLDDDPPADSSSTQAEAGGPPPKPPPEQRIQLAQALLAIGDLPAALYFLSKFPWIAQSHIAIADIILRNIDFALEELYRSVTLPTVDNDGDDLDVGASAPTSAPTSKDLTPTLHSPPPPDTNLKRFIFFYPGWRDNMEKWTSVEEINDKGLRWLSLIRGLGGRDASIMVRICRIGVAHFAALKKEKEGKMETGDLDTSEALEEMKPWLDIIRISLLPSLSCSNATAAFDVELWTLLSFFPYTVRYSLYGEWRDSTCSFKGRNPCPVAAHAASECTKEVQKALRRVTSSSTSGSASAATQAERHSARLLAKLSHGNPLFLWTTAVTQVKAYPNIGSAIVDAGRYMTQLSFDVATFVMLDTLSDDRAQRLNETGTGVALWLERLSKFVGDFNRRYVNMDLGPVLQYIINRLMRGQSGDLIILEKLMSSMSGIEPVPNDGVSDTQLQAYGGGKEMVKEAFNTTRIQIAPPPEPGTDKPKEAPVDKLKNIKKSLPRLVNALKSTGMAIPIWIALAQTRQAVVDKQSDTPIKAMNLVQDTCHTAFMQFGDFLVEQLSSEEQLASTPSLQELVEDFGLEYGMAFQILRPKLNAELDKAKAEHDANLKKRLEAERKAGTERLASPAVDPTKMPVSPLAATLQSETEDVIMEDIKNEHPNGDVASATKAGGKGKPWWPIPLTATMKQAKALLPQDVNEALSAPFFVIFWHLTMSDIAFSPESYDEAIKSINRNISIVSGWRIMVKDKTAVAEQQAEVTRLKNRVAVLEKEKEAHGKEVNAVIKRRLKTESAKWFAEKSLQTVTAAQLHQYCFYPRAILTPCDAVFVAKFIRTAHDLGTVGFSTLYAYNNFFNDNLAACIFSCTDSEARNFGRCLAAILADLDVWHRDEKVYKLEALGLKPDQQAGEETQKTLPGMLFRKKPAEPIRHMEWQEFRSFYAKCHNTLSKALVSCWSEAEFMHNKNAIIVALQVIKFFPAMDTNGNAVEAAVKKLQSGKNGEITNDLKMMCLSFLTGLKKRQEVRPYVSSAKFYPGGQRQAQAAQAAQAKNVPTGPKASDSPAPNGNATPHSTNGSSTPVSTPANIADREKIRQKLEESRNKSTSSVTAKSEVKSTPEPAVETIKTEAQAASSRAPSPARPEVRPTSPPVAPRHTRASAAPTGPAATTRSVSDGRNTPIPAGPSRSAAEKPVVPSASMGPPSDLAVDEARAAARAKKFGSIKRPAPPPSSASPAATPAPTVPPALPIPAEPRPKSPTPASSRRTSPAPKTRRSGSVESKASVGSRRSARRERDERDRDRDRDRVRESDRDRDRERERRRRDDRERDRERDKPREVPASAPAPAADEDKDRRKQEDLLQARHDRLAGSSASADDRRDARRSSRDTGSHRRDVEREKDATKPRERTTRDRDDRGEKRKRDEEPRRIDDPPRRDTGRDRERERRHERPDERDRDRHRDTRNGVDKSERERDRERDDRERDRRGVPRAEREARDTRDSRPPAREAARRSPGPPSRQPSVPAADRRPDNTNGSERTPRRDNAPRELLPASRDNPLPTPPAANDRIVEAPRQTRSSAPPTSNNNNSSTANRLAHALPPRPGAASNSPAPAAGRSGNGPSLTERMGGVPDQPQRSDRRSPPPRTRSGDNRDRERGGEGYVDPRKRALEETGTPAREESPGASKRVKIDRERARGSSSRREGGPGGRLFESAMREK